MSVLVDTQAVAWYLIPGPRLTKRARVRMAGATRLFVSLASVWEANIKRAKHGDARLGSLGPWLDRMRETGLPEPFELLPIEFEDCYAVRDLPAVHGDPFDRMIAAQARRRTIPVISADPVFDAYGCERVW